MEAIRGSYRHTAASWTAEGMCIREAQTEPRLQELCDGILLAGCNVQLIREYPQMRWGAVGTKPDWSSAKEPGLWVEMKYVRTKRILPITEAIAADITKYGDNNTRTFLLCTTLTTWFWMNRGLPNQLIGGKQ